MLGHPSSTSFDFPPTAVPRTLGPSQDLYAPPSPPSVPIEEFWPKSFEVRWRECVTKQDLGCGVKRMQVSGVGTSASPGARHCSILVVYTILLLAISTAHQCVDATHLCSNSLVL